MVIKVSNKIASLHAILIFENICHIKYCRLFFSLFFFFCTAINLIKQVIIRNLSLITWFLNVVKRALIVRFVKVPRTIKNIISRLIVQTCWFFLFFFRIDRVESMAIVSRHISWKKKEETSTESVTLFRVVNRKSVFPFFVPLNFFYSRSLR